MAKKLKSKTVTQSRTHKYIKDPRHAMLQRDRIAQAERAVSRLPLTVTGLTAHEVEWLAERIWCLSVDEAEGTVKATMNVLPLIVNQLYQLWGDCPLSVRKAMVGYVVGRQ